MLGRWPGNEGAPGDSLRLMDVPFEQSDATPGVLIAIDGTEISLS
jgi:hypothetical protein